MPLTDQERKEQSEAFHRGLFEQIFGAPPEEVVPALRETIAAERARRERLAAEHPEDWEVATTTQADVEKKIQEIREAQLARKKAQEARREAHS